MGWNWGVQQALEPQIGDQLVLLLSDGQANVGETDLEKVGMRGSAARTNGLVVSTLGVGADYNEALMGRNCCPWGRTLLSHPIAASNCFRT